jgi:hypothetical protein
MGDAPPPLHPLPRIAATCLARGLDALAARTDAPLRVRHRMTSRWCELLDVVEEPELGGPGRRFLVSVDRRPHPTALLVGRR